jgi:hypothetical protein
MFSFRPNTRLGPTFCSVVFWSLLLPAAAQESRIIPGPPPDEYVDVTGDGRADLLITNRTIHISDPQQPGYLGLYKVGVRTLAGTAVLMWSTPSNQRWFTLDSTARLDTAELAARIHFKQLSWTDEDRPTEFWLLERPFGPAITKDQDGWYGTGDHHDGHTMVLRSANDLGTSVAAFTFELPFPYGRVVVRSKESVRVPNGYGEEGDPVLPQPKVAREYDFAHEAPEPQVIIPPGVAPTESVDLTSDDIPDVLLVTENAPYHATEPMGTYTRGLRMADSAAFLMEKQADGRFSLFMLPDAGRLTPEELTMGLHADRLRWAQPQYWRVFVPLLEQHYGRIRAADEPIGWLPVGDPMQGLLVFRATQYGRPMIGALELHADTPGGRTWVQLQGLVEEGQVLQVR